MIERRKDYEANGRPSYTRLDFGEFILKLHWIASRLSIVSCFDNCQEQIVSSQLWL